MTIYLKKFTCISLFACFFILSETSRASEKIPNKVELLCEGTISSNVEWYPVIRIMYTKPPQNLAQSLEYQDGKFFRYISPFDQNKPLIIIWVDNIPHYTYSAEFVFNNIKSEIHETVQIDELNISYFRKSLSQGSKKSYITTFSLNRYSGYFQISKKSLNGDDKSSLSAGSGFCKRTSRIF
jgi:hypothetical protein